MTIEDQTTANLLSQLAIIKVTGAEAGKFLQGQLSCDVLTLDNMQTCLGCYCDHKGRVITNFRLWKDEGNYYLILPLSLVDLTLAELAKFAIFSKVEITQIEDYQMVGIIGKQANEVLTKINLPIPETNQVSFKNDIAIISENGIIPRYMLIIAKNNLQTLSKQLENLITIENDDHLWQLIAILSGFAEINELTSGLFLPHHLNYHQTDVLNFKKGCFRGQEIIARMHYRGQLKQHLYQASSEATNHNIRLGEDIIDAEENKVGQVVNACKSVNHYALLITLFDKALEQNNLKIKSTHQKIEVQT